MWSRMRAGKPTFLTWNLRRCTSDRERGQAHLPDLESASMWIRMRASTPTFLTWNLGRCASDASGGKPTFPTWNLRRCGFVEKKPDVDLHNGKDSLKSVLLIG